MAKKSDNKEIKDTNEEVNVATETNDKASEIINKGNSIVSKFCFFMFGVCLGILVAFGIFTATLKKSADKIETQTAATTESNNEKATDNSTTDKTTENTETTENK